MPSATLTALDAAGVPPGTLAARVARLDEQIAAAVHIAAALRAAQEEVP
jgi:hypothetical protein